MHKTSERRLAVGAEIVAGGASFRVWAPACRIVAVAVEDAEEIALDAEGGGYHSGTVAGLAAGARYRFRLDGGAETYPDPASRFQPDGVHGASEIVDPFAFEWHDRTWRGVRLAGQIIYELHVGTFTPEGTWAGAASRLSHLKAVGITLIEIMPIAEFAGRFGWGYDGVDLFAPTRLYGGPDDLRCFVDAAHGLGIGVILDVVYNHFGPDGCYLRQFSPDYLTDKHPTDWGEAVNFDGGNAAGVRDFVLANARYWIEEFHFDGLRLDATQNIYDRPDDHILAEIGRAARAAAGERSIVLIAENESQEARLVRARDDEGYGLDALWNDDFHHSALVAVTGHNPAYYSDHRGGPQEFISAAKYGYLFQGQRYAWQKQPRGEPALDIAPAHFVLYTQNHDQVANSAWGRRIQQVAGLGDVRATTALLLLLPGTPMLFQGQEFGASSPFLYFADHNPELAAQVRDGRHAFLRQFPALAGAEMARRLADPAAESSFLRSKLDWSECDRNEAFLSLHRDLIALRQTDPVFATQKPGALDGAVLSDRAFALRFFGGADGDRLLFVNFGADVNAGSIADPLVAPPRKGAWRMRWSSEDPNYGGDGVADVQTPEGWHIPGHAAFVLTSTD